MSLKAKIAGGSQMFQFGSSDTIRIGPRNVEAVKQGIETAYLFQLLLKIQVVRVAAQLNSILTLINA